MSATAIEVNEANFERDVLQASERIPVLVDFWAPWCGPCRALAPVLERLAAAMKGRFVLAKINTDDNPALAARYGIRGIPNVKLFFNREAIAEFTGALPESEVRAFLERELPGEGEKLRLAAQAALRSGEFEAAEARLREALRVEPDLRAAALDLAELLIARQAWEEAERLLDRIPPRERDERAEQLLRRIALWRRSSTLPPAAELRAAVERSPRDPALRMQFAERLQADGQLESALDQLLEIVRRDRGEWRDKARQAMIEIFALAEDQPELVSRYRRMLASALY